LLDHGHWRDPAGALAMSEGRATAAPPEDDLGAEPAVAPERGPWWERFVTGSSTWIGLILIGLILAFSVLEFESFVSASNARNIATDAAVLLVLATGMTFVIITAGIDLSDGAVLVFSGVVSVKAMGAVGGDNWGTIAAGLVVALAAGTAWGTLNGFLIAKARIPPLIVTLGTLGMSLGAALLITGGVDERDVPFKLVTTIGSGRVFEQVPYLVIIAVAVALVFGVVLAATRFGRYTYAVGSNVEAARRAGIPVDRHLIKVYALAGMLSGLAGFMSAARFATTTIGGHDTDNLQAIAAVVIGGTSLFGGIGTMLGTVFGVFIPAVLQNGFVIVGVQPFWQQVAVGAVLIGAVYLDQLRRRSQHRR
jgi:ribose transport system permease protein